MSTYVLKTRNSHSKSGRKLSGSDDDDWISQTTEFSLPFCVNFFKIIIILKHRYMYMYSVFIKRNVFKTEKIFKLSSDHQQDLSMAVNCAQNYKKLKKFRPIPETLTIYKSGKELCGDGLSYSVAAALKTDLQHCNLKSP